MSEQQRKPTIAEMRLYAEHLRQTIILVLADAGNTWLHTAEIADKLNRDNLCSRPDGAAITPLLIGRQTRNYAHIFERIGCRVRLRETPLD
jgi:hypothetical protein